jgi:hypothetical protein
MLHSAGCLKTDVSGLRIGPVFKSQSTPLNFPEDGGIKLVHTIFGENVDSTDRHFHETTTRICVSCCIYRQTFVKGRNVWDKSCREEQNRRFMANKLFSKNPTSSGVNRSKERAAFVTLCIYFPACIFLVAQMNYDALKINI